MGLEIVRTVAQLRKRVVAWHATGEAVALVPTMGALHEGHLTLMRAARARAGRVVVSIFVNPRQFNNAQDLDAYPRTGANDVRLLEREGVDLLYAPDAEEMYPAGFATTVSVAGVSEELCGAFRPGHFDGVATVVTKLFLQSGADVALFGEKDFQQLAVIRQMTRDLDIPVEIVGVPTVRETDGLALSSRNVRLSEKGRASAVALSATLAWAAEALNAAGSAEVLAEARARLEEAGFTEVEYFELRDSATLAPLEGPDRPARLLVAAWIDGVRLIDNVVI